MNFSEANLITPEFYIHWLTPDIESARGVRIGCVRERVSEFKSNGTYRFIDATEMNPCMDG